MYLFSRDTNYLMLLMEKMNTKTIETNLLNKIFLQRKLKLVVPEGNAALPISKSTLATGLKQLEKLGFTFSKPLMDRVFTLSEAEFQQFMNSAIEVLKVMLGANVVHRALFKNFNRTVMSMDESELYIKQLVSYIDSAIRDITGVVLENRTFESESETYPLLDNKKLKVINLGTEEEFFGLVKSLISAKTSISDADKQDIKDVIDALEDISVILPVDIPHKENMTFAVSAMLQGEKITVSEAAAYIKTATDVLRLAAAMSDGDVSLSSPVRFRKFKRPERRFFLGLVEKINNPVEDMLRYRGLWITLGEIINPGQYKTRFPKTFESFDILRNKKPFKTFYGKLETALNNEDIDLASSLLEKRPGEFARKLDRLLRLASNETEQEQVINSFANVADDISTPVLLQVLAHFKNRNSQNSLRTFFPKGNIAKAFAIENTLPEISEALCCKIQMACNSTLTKRFSELKTLGSVYVDEHLMSYLVPFSQRSASKALKTIVRGSKIDLGDSNTIRAFVYWKEGKVGDTGVRTGTVDLDASYYFLSEDFTEIETVSYYSLRSQLLNACHSGDFTSAPKGATEFVDFDIEKAVENGVRYVVMSVNSFSEHPFCDLPECFVGWMEREYPDSGESYEPTSVANKIDVAADTQITIPVIFDVVERKAIWCDLALTKQPFFPNNVEENKQGIVLTARAMTTLVKPNLYDLFMLHAVSRGILVSSKDKADTVFSVNEGITPFAIEEIMADFIV